MAPLQKISFGGFGSDDLHRIMAISNELSSEIAAAILANKNSPQDLLKLRDVVLEIHSTLQKMSEQEHKSRLREVRISSPSSGREAGSH